MSVDAHDLRYTVRTPANQTNIIYGKAMDCYTEKTEAPPAGCGVIGSFQIDTYGTGIKVLHEVIMSYIYEICMVQTLQCYMV